MSDKIDSKDVVSPGSVGKVSEEPLAIHEIKYKRWRIEIICIYASIAVISFFCIYVLVSGNQEIKEFKNAAWSVLAGFAGALLSRLAGSKDRNNNES